MYIVTDKGDIFDLNNLPEDIKIEQHSKVYSGGPEIMGLIGTVIKTTATLEEAERISKIRVALNNAVKYVEDNYNYDIAFALVMGALDKSIKMINVFVYPTLDDLYNCKKIDTLYYADNFFGRIKDIRLLPNAIGANTALYTKLTSSNKDSIYEYRLQPLIELITGNNSEFINRINNSQTKGEAIKELENIVYNIVMSKLI